MTETKQKDKEYEDRVLIVVVVIAVLAIFAVLHFWRDWLVFRAPMWVQVLMYIAGLLLLLGKAAKWIEKNVEANAKKSQEESDKITKP
jgi:uncharacterized protein (DUF983 family)